LSSPFLFPSVLCSSKSPSTVHSNSQCKTGTH
jgi:hypothetical protein